MRKQKQWETRQPPPPKKKPPWITKASKPVRSERDIRTGKIEKD